MCKIVLPILASILLLVSLHGLVQSSSAFTFTQPPGLGINATSGASAEKTVENIIVNVISIFFAVGGIGTVIYFVWGTVDWILSGGDKEKVANARKKMTHAIIGLVLLSLSFVIINLVGTIVGFNPLGNLQLRDLGTPKDPLPNKDLNQ